MTDNGPPAADHLSTLTSTVLAQEAERVQSQRAEEVLFADDLLPVWDSSLGASGDYRPSSDVINLG